MILKLTGAASALLTLVLITAVGIGADEKKEEKKAGTKPDFFGAISAYKEGESISITKRVKKGEDAGPPKEFKIDKATTKIEKTPEDLMIKEGLFAAVWFTGGDEKAPVAKIAVREGKKKKKTE